MRAVCADECRPDYAVSGPLVVPDVNLTASSVSDPAHRAPALRLHALAAGTRLSCWRPVTLDTAQWIQVSVWGTKEGGGAGQGGGEGGAVSVKRVVVGRRVACTGLHTLAAGLRLSCWRPGTLDASQWLQVSVCVWQRKGVVGGGVR